MRPDHKDPQWLREKYVDEGLTQQEIADLVGVTQSAINHHISRLESVGKRSIDFDERLDDVARVAEAVDGRLLRSEYQEHGNFGTSSFYSVFETWDEVVNTATGDENFDASGLESCEITEDDVVGLVSSSIDAERIGTSYGPWYADLTYQIYNQNVAIEAKGHTTSITDVRKGVGQAISYLEHGADFAYVAVPEDTVIDEHLPIFRSVGVGLIAVDPGEIVVVVGGGLKRFETVVLDDEPSEIKPDWLELDEEQNMTEDEMMEAINEVL